MSDATHTRDAVHATIDAHWRIEAARVIGATLRVVHDLDLAEECAQDALLAALEHWPFRGTPANPGAWLTAVAKRRALDLLRHGHTVRKAEADVARELDFRHVVASEEFADQVDAALDDDIGDDTLRLIFAACHPLLSPEARAALTLRVVGGLSTDEIARAFLKPEPTIAQRIVRAKRTLSAAKVPFEVPRGAALRERLGSVLEVIYLIFNEGYAATAGEHWLRPTVAEEAQRLGRILCDRLPEESEVFGLTALMELQASRFAARHAASGEPVLLMDQDRSRWDRLLIHRGLAALGTAETLAAREDGLGSYALQAAIAACHARAARAEDTDWVRIVALYDGLAQIHASPIVRLNRAVAVSMAYGPAAALEIVDGLAAEPAMERYHLLPSVRGDLLAKLGRDAEAAAEFRRAAELTQNAAERRLMLARVK